jgi:hypothetical protein
MHPLIDTIELREVRILRLNNKFQGLEECTIGREIAENKNSRTNYVELLNCLPDESA